HDVLCGPVALDACRFDETLEKRQPLRCMPHLRVELQAVDVAFRGLHGSDGTTVCRGGDHEAGRGFGDTVTMAHPGAEVAFDTLEECPVVVCHAGLAVLARAATAGLSLTSGGRRARLDPATELSGDQLHA